MLKWRLFPVTFIVPCLKGSLHLTNIWLASLNCVMEIHHGHDCALLADTKFFIKETEFSF